MTAAIPIEFEPAPAIRAAGEAIQEQAAEARRQIEDEIETAVVAANTYAIHLAEGGDPLAYREGLEGEKRRLSYANVSPFVGLAIVYRAWNAERGAPHDFLPFQNHYKWAIAERLTETLGFPASYQELCEVWNTIGGRQVGYRSKPSSDAIAGAALDVETTSEGRLVARRAKVDGKVGFLVRERRPDDPEQGAYRASSLPEEV